MPVTEVVRQKPGLNKKAVSIGGLIPFPIRFLYCPFDCKEACCNEQGPAEQPYYLRYHEDMF